MTKSCASSRRTCGRAFRSGDTPCVRPLRRHDRPGQWLVRRVLRLPHGGQGRLRQPHAGAPQAGRGCDPGGGPRAPHLTATPKRHLADPLTRGGCARCHPPSVSSDRRSNSPGCCSSLRWSKTYACAPSLTGQASASTGTAKGLQVDAIVEAADGRWIRRGGQARPLSGRRATCSHCATSSPTRPWRPAAPSSSWSRIRRPTFVPTASSLPLRRSQPRTLSARGNDLGPVGGTRAQPAVGSGPG